MSEEIRLWGGRFGAGPADAFDRLNASLSVDRRLWPEDVMASRAHARMLGAQGIIPPEDAAAIDAGLVQVGEELASGEFVFREADEDIHTAVERRLTELVGDAGRRLHTGRSRNDQVITDTLLHLRAHATAQIDGLRALAEALLAQADAHLDTLLPGYTHSQRAQPVRLAHHLLAYVWMLDRDRTRLGHAIDAASAECPLGSGALSGVGFPIDRERTAADLGFLRPSPNSLDAVGSRDALIDYLHFAAQLGVHLSRLGGEIVTVGRRRDRLRDARRRLHLGLLDAPPEEEPRRGRAGPGQGAPPPGRPRWPAGGAFRPAAGVQQGSPGGQGVPLRRHRHG